MNPHKDFDTQVKMLNSLVRLRIAPSEIHGVGIFATEDIPVDTKIYADNQPEFFSLPFERFDELKPSVRQILLERWPLIVTGSMFVYPDARMLAYMNHSDKPNYDAKNDRTLREIKKGEEITEDYRQIATWETVHPWMVDKS